MTDLQGEKITIEYIPLDQAVLWDENPKSHDVGSLCESIARYGFVDPPKFDATLGAFVYGNGRTIALRMMQGQGALVPRGVLIDESGTWFIPVKFGVDQASRDVARALAVDHNNLTMLGGDFPAWDVAKMWNESYPDLLRLLAEAETLPVSVDGDDLDALLRLGEQDGGGDAPEAQIDRAAELQEKWGVKRGDIWRVGEHFIFCGDCREQETWDKLLAAAGIEKANGVFTSPPYAEQRRAQYGGVPTAEYVEWWEAAQANVRANLADDGSFFVNIKPHCEDGQRVLYVFDLVLAMVRRWGWRFVDELCWVRNSLPGKFVGRFKNHWESVFNFSMQEHKFKPQNVVQPFSCDPQKLHYYDPDKHATLGANYAGSAFGRDFSVKSRTLDGALPSNVVMIETGWRTDNTGQHAAAFPVALPAFFVKAYSDAGDVWCDPFLGSGTTIVAAHNEGRRGIGIELLEKYVSVCLQRLADMGLSPRLVTDGPA